MTIIYAYVFPVIVIASGIVVLFALGPFVRDIQREIRGRVPK